MSGFVPPTIVAHRATRTGATITGGARSGRALRFDGTPYAVTSQAATDALVPHVTGGTLIGWDETLQQASIQLADSGECVRVIAAGAITAGNRIRPAFNADAALNDRYTAAALPVAAGTYYTTHVALEAATAAGQVIWAQAVVAEYVVAGGGG